MQRKGLDDGDTWVSITDLMTGMMAMFMLMALVYMFKREQQDPLREHRIMEENIYNALKKEFKEEEVRRVITVDSSLTMRFIDQHVRMFDVGKATMKPDFKGLLDTVLPKFIELVTRDSVIERLSEIRVEGHASSDYDPNYEDNNRNKYPDSLFSSQADKRRFLSYEYNSQLSQRRSQAVVQFIRSHRVYRSLGKDKRDRLDFLVTSTGMSYARRLDSNGGLSYLTGKSEDKQGSLRVEFKLVTSRPDGLVNELQNAP